MRDITTGAADWRFGAACADEDPELFFPDSQNATRARRQTNKAKKVCGRCPVMEICLQWALETRQESGVWGGLSEEERYALKRRTARPRQEAQLRSAA
ncbi:WhiB family transcriptional regulator [Streptomyces mayteni]